MRDYQQRFLQVSLDNSILQFRKDGFTLKSGRNSPYFFNAGMFNTGRLLSELSTAYAKALLDPKNEFDFDILFGPAYKGIPLAVATSQALANLGSDVAYSFNRKEVKDHGEGGSIVGSALQGKKVVIIDDVITSGKAIREAVEIISMEGGLLTGILVAVDRQEQTLDSKSSAIESLRTALGINIHAIITLQNIIDFTKTTLDSETVKLMEDYRKSHGVES
jgi:orotate phosphoribosyltransferase